MKKSDELTTREKNEALIIALQEIKKILDAQK